MTVYATPAAFKQALEARLRGASANGTDFSRRRQLLVFDLAALPNANLVDADLTDADVASFSFSISPLSGSTMLGFLPE